MAGHPGRDRGRGDRRRRPVRGRRDAVRAPSAPRTGRAAAADARWRPLAGGRRRLPTPLILLAVAIACYVASEVGVSNWLVRFLEPAPLTQATTALALFWGGLALGRLTAARLADRYDHIRFAIASAAATGGRAHRRDPRPVAAGLDRAVRAGRVRDRAGLPDDHRHRRRPLPGALVGRSRASSAASAVVGSIVYPPVMGFLSVTVGLTVAMLGTVVLAFACAGALLLVSRQPADEPVPRGRVDSARCGFEPTILGTGKNAAGIEIPDEVVAALGKGKRPPVRITINGYTYRNTVAVMGGVFMVGVSAEHRAAAGLAAGDEVDVDIELDTAPRELAVPDDFAAALDADPEAERTFDGLSYSNRSWHVLSIDGAKTAETRQRRIEKSIATLHEGRPR